ncbi:unnamed protein product [Coffea canephora]|uniref:Uncharacterized protein n=1 Tax=Coffea canephora TaxID=49390 RepID=A0A068UDS7_COFCA|nr:unnamed protein product [Coffea canephora]
MMVYMCRYAFKCHQKSGAGRDIVYPIEFNCISSYISAMVHLLLGVVMVMLVCGMETTKKGCISLIQLTVLKIPSKPC